MRIRTVVLAGTAGAVVSYLFDPRRGGERRRRLRSQVVSAVQRGRRSGPPMELPAEIAAAAPPSGVDLLDQETVVVLEDIGEETTDDAELVRAVRSSLDERHDLRADELVIDVVNGVVYLAGDLEDRQTFGEVVDVARAVPGVRRVQSLLHLPPSDVIPRPDLAES
jgi:hypothetical protein